MQEMVYERAEEWLRLLKANGYRSTAPRRAVVEVLITSPYILNPQEVHAQARALYPRLGLVTVYRTLEKLEELGLLQRVHQPSGCQGFVAVIPGHKHLLICQDCGLVEYFDGDHEGIDNLATGIEQDSGYRIRDHWLQLFGICASCQQSI